jgi:hypothetical protein
MTQRNSPSFSFVTVIALIGTGAGIYFTLIGLGVISVPGGDDTLHAPLWIVVCAGLVFVLGGGAVVLRDAAGADPDTGELPRNAPHWVRIAQHLMALALYACFALIGTWIAFGPGERAFSGTIAVGPTLGRIVFGIGAVILWLTLVGSAISGGRKLLRRSRE